MFFFIEFIIQKVPLYFRFDIKDETDDVIFQLMQKDTRDRKQDGIQNIVIGFHIMKVCDIFFMVIVVVMVMFLVIKFSTMRPANYSHCSSN